MIIFDFGVVLARGHIKDMYRRLEAKLRVTESEFQHLKNHWIDKALTGHISTEEFLNNIAEKLRITPEELKEKWQESYDEAIKVDPDVLDIIKRLKQHDSVVLLTNVIELDAEVNRNRGDYDLFDQVFTSYECQACKPGMEIFMHVTRKLGVDPKECIFIDDAAENLIPAAAIGMRVIHFRDASTLKNDLHAMGAL